MCAGCSDRSPADLLPPFSLLPDNEQDSGGPNGVWKALPNLVTPPVRLQTDEKLFAKIMKTCVVVQTGLWGRGVLLHHCPVFLSHLDTSTTSSVFTTSRVTAMHAINETGVRQPGVLLAKTPDVACRPGRAHMLGKVIRPTQVGSVLVFSWAARNHPPYISPYGKKHLFLQLGTLNGWPLTLCDTDSAASQGHQ